MDTLLFILTLLAALGSGLNAGLFFIFSNTIMRSLAQLPPPQGIAAMQAINRVIQNPLFFLIFIGTGLITLLLALSSIWRWSPPGSLYLLAGSLLYLLGDILVTIIFNVPMNNALDTARPDTPESIALWSRYLTRR